MAKSARSSHDTSRVTKEPLSTAADLTAGRDGDVEKMRDLDRLLAQFDKYFPGFTGAVLKITQNER
jgi:hypothetical protein